MADWNVEPDGLPRPVEPRVERESFETWQFEQFDGADPEQIRRLVAFLSQLMDSSFELPGLRWRFGLDALVGLIPVVGDAVTTMVSLAIISLAGRLGLPRITLARMTLNVMIDLVIGAVPLVGDVFDVWWKANLRNARLLEARLADPNFGSRRARTGDWLFVAAMILGVVAVFVAIVAVAGFVLVAIWRAVVGAFA